MGDTATQYNSHNDVVFAATVSGRPAEIKNIERMIGLFINAVPVRIRTSPKQTFKELLQKIHNEAAQGKDYHYFSLAEIQAQTKLLTLWYSVLYYFIHNLCKIAV